MPLVSMRQLLDEAAAGGYGVGAFNVNNMEQIQAIMEAARETESPVIVQASRGARSYSQDRYLRHLMLAAAELYPEIPIVMHQDHGNSPETCISAIENGFTSVMMDGSLKEDGKTPRRLRVQRRGHARGRRAWPTRGACRSKASSARWAASKTATASGDACHLTDPDQAVGIRASDRRRRAGRRHRHQPRRVQVHAQADGEVLAMDRIEEIHQRLPDTHLVMHGSSSVPQELQDVINKYGGKLKQTWGVPVEEIQRGIKHGVRKINVDTDNRLAITGAIRKVLTPRSPEKFDPRDYLKPAREAMKKVCGAHDAFGQAGHAGDYVPLSLAEMRRATRYPPPRDRRRVHAGRAASGRHRGRHRRAARHLDGDAGARIGLPARPHGGHDRARGRAPPPRSRDRGRAQLRDRSGIRPGQLADRGDAALRGRAGPRDDERHAGGRRCCRVLADRAPGMPAEPRRAGRRARGRRHGGAHPGRVLRDQRGAGAGRRLCRRTDLRCMAGTAQ